MVLVIQQTRNNKKRHTYTSLPHLQISKIVSSIPNLDFLNLSSNPLGGLTLEPRCAEAFSRVRRLVLNNTQVSWENVLLLTRETPE